MAMKKAIEILTFTLIFIVTTPVYAQVEVEELTFKESLKLAEEQDKIVILHFYQSQGDEYRHLFQDPLVASHLNELAVTTQFAASSEAGEAFAKPKRKRRRAKKSSEVREPGIYFFTAKGRLIGVLTGPLAGDEGVGKMMMMLGATQYAKHENKSRRHSYRRTMM